MSEFPHRPLKDSFKGDFRFPQTPRALCRGIIGVLCVGMAVPEHPLSTKKGLNIPIVSSLHIGREQGVEHGTGAAQGQAWICVSKGKAAAARKWYEKLRQL